MSVQLPPKDGPGFEHSPWHQAGPAMAGQQMEELPAGAGHFLQVREISSAAAPVLGILAGAGVGWVGANRVEVGAGAGAGVLGGVVVLVTIYLVYRLMLWASTTVLDTLGARRGERTSTERQDWAQRHGWSFEAGPRPIDAQLVPVALPGRTEPDRALRTLRGRFRGRSVHLETWVVRRPYQRRRYHRGDAKVWFRPVLSTVLVLRTAPGLPRAGFFPSNFLGIENGPPALLAGERLRWRAEVRTRVASPDVPPTELVDQVGEQVRKLGNPSKFRLITSPALIALTMFEEPEINRHISQLEVLSDIADVLERSGAGPPVSPSHEGTGDPSGPRELGGARHGDSVDRVSPVGRVSPVDPMGTEGSAALEQMAVVMGRSAGHNGEPARMIWWAVGRPEPAGPG